MKRGSKPKPKEAHILAGTFRADRHDGEPVAEGVPVRPPDMKGEAKALWDSITPQLVANGTAKNLDTSALVACCELWGLYRAAYAVASAAPADKDARIALTAYYAAWERAATRLGLSPADRARLRVPGDGKAKSPESVSGFARQRKTS